MANYNSIEELLNAGTSNMTVLRNNNGNDDSTETFDGVSWFTFNNVVANNIYISGNTWLGFGTNAEQLRVNRRDAKVWYIWREEGTLYNYYRFLKWRWRGYSAYNQTSANYLLEYDVILWETGDISLHMVNIPVTNNDGTKQLIEGSQTYNYTYSAEQPDVTFYKSGSGRTVTNALIDLRLPYDKRYLIRANGKLYDVAGEEIATAVLNAAAFQEYGSDRKPQQEVIAGFTNPDVILWHDSTEYLPTLTAEVVAVPFAQVIYSGDYDLTDETILGIEDADVIASEDILFALSFDMGETWKAYNGAAWLTLTSEDSGMNTATFNSIGVEAWAEVVTGAEKFRIRAIIPTGSSYIESVIINFIN